MWCDVLCFVRVACKVVARCSVVNLRSPVFQSVTVGVLWEAGDEGRVMGCGLGARKDRVRQTGQEGRPVEE